MDSQENQSSERINIKKFKVLKINQAQSTNGTMPKVVFVLPSGDELDPVDLCCNSYSIFEFKEMYFQDKDCKVDYELM